VTQSIRLAGQVSPTGEVSATFATVGGASVAVDGTVEGRGDTVNFAITYHC
jgi:hypothetical protein